MAYVIESERDYDNYINQDCLVVIDFYGEYCPPCKALSPVFDRFAQEFSHILFMKVDVDQFVSIASKEGVYAVPTIIFYKSGVKKDTIIGADLGKIKANIITYA